MAGVNLQIDVRGADTIQKALSRIAQEGGNLRESLGDVGEHLLNRHRKRWEHEQSPDGIPWEPLAEQYAERKRQARPSSRILVYDDLLKGTLRYQLRGNTLELGTDRPYGATHQFGRDFGRGAPIPARPFLGLSKADERDVLDIIREHLRRTIDRV